MCACVSAVESDAKTARGRIRRCRALAVELPLGRAVCVKFFGGGGELCEVFIDLEAGVDGDGNLATSALVAVFEPPTTSYSPDRSLPAAVGVLNCAVRTAHNDLRCVERANTLKRSDQRQIELSISCLVNHWSSMTA